MSGLSEPAVPDVGRAGSSRLWSFAACALDEGALELRVQGQVVEIDRKPLNVLLHFLRHAGEVVTKDELAEAVWTGRIITDATLSKTVALLRAALRDDDQLIIKTVYGYGYRLVAPVSLQARISEPTPRFDLKEGESPPLRPEWALVRRLGAGGHGEVWLARHRDSDAQRVFKFAEGGGPLTALKREITLNRLLRETLPERQDYLRLLDWNIEQPPFHVESEYLASGSLAAWVKSQGGVSAIPLATRLELMAQIAEAVAAAHGVGVLHKDLKPGNVLIAGEAGDPRIRLCDFGSGGVLDTKRLDALGITRHGFTHAVPVGETTSATPLYLAPEVIAGQPFTVQSDIYALGVILYQFVAGELGRPLAAGWEKDVDDELLREDIAAAIAGRPADRLGDASLLAQRLRTLTPRRQQREVERAQREQAAQAQKLRGDLKRLRLTAAVVGALAVGAAAAGVIAFKARNEAREAMASTEAVNAFLNNDLLASADPRRGPTRDLTMRQVLDRAAENVGGKFKDQPAVAAQVHATLGQAYLGVGELERAKHHLEQSADLYDGLHGADSPQRRNVLRLLVGVLKHMGHLDEGCALAREIRAGLESETAPGWGCDPKANEAALAEQLALVHELERQGQTQDARYGDALYAVGSALFNLGEAVEAAQIMRRSVKAIESLRGPTHLETAQQRAFLALCLIHTGELDEAETELFRALEDQKKWVGDASTDIGAHTVLVAFLRLEQGRSAEAERFAREFLDSALGRQIGSGYRPAALLVLSEALLLQGKLEQAIPPAQEAIAASQQLKMPKEAHEFHARSYWAEALLQQNKPAEATDVLGAITPDELGAVPAANPGLAKIRRVLGLLLRSQGREREALPHLKLSYDAYLANYGDRHWRTRRAQRELSATETPQRR